MKRHVRMNNHHLNRYHVLFFCLPTCVQWPPNSDSSYQVMGNLVRLIYYFLYIDNRGLAFVSLFMCLIMPKA